MKQSEAKLLSISLKSMEEKGKVAVKIARNIRMIDDELKEYYQYEAELFKKYGEEKDGQLIVEKTSPLFEEFSKELNELDLDVEFPFRKITEQELIDSGLSAKQMAMIWDYMVEKLLMILLKEKA